jgi:hypothetical protein
LILARAVKEVHEGEAYGSAQEAVERVQDGVPAGNQYVVVVNLAKDLGSKDKRVDDCLE